MINTNSKIAKQFWETGKLPCPILDFHAHMNEHASIYFPAGDVDGMMRSMNNFNVRWLMFFDHLEFNDPLYAKHFAVEAVNKYPNRLRAYRGILSRHLNPEEDIRAVDENPDIYVGFKILGDYNKFPISDPIHDPYYQYLNDTKKLLLIHTWDKSPFDGAEQVRKIAERFPDIVIICGHTFFGDIEHGIEITKEFPNVYYELTAIPIIRGFLEDIVEAAGGSDRILFGTDLPWFSTMHGAGMVLSADISDEDRLNIFYRNGDKILSRFPWYTLD